jgi:hypothetical protein
MTIDDAIKLLESADLLFWPSSREKDLVALKMGIEALKRVKLQHDPDGVTTPRLLPGETEVKKP